MNIIIVLILLYTIYTLLKSYISISQINFIEKEKNKKAILLNEENYKIAGEYAIKKEKLGIFITILDYFLFIFWITIGLPYFLADILYFNSDLLNAVILVFIFIGVNYIIGLPLEIYQTFKIDKEYGFTQTTYKLYIQDQLKSIAMFLIFGTAVLTFLIWIISNFNYWWLWSFLFIFSISLIINLIYPTFIAPIFNKFSELSDSDLKTDIEKMMIGVGLKSSGIFTMDASKRDKRLNAYFGGLGKTKRVVLFDTLIEKLNKKEILAVLGHELGHFTNGDIWKNIGMMGILIFITFFIVGNIEYGEAGQQLIFIILIMPLISFLFTPILSLVSRHNEYAADNFGANLGGKENLVSALIKLVDENRSFPKSHPLVIFFYYTHPPILERLKELE